MKFGQYEIQLTAKGWVALVLLVLAGIILFIAAWTLGLFAFLITILIALAQLLWAAFIWLATQTGLLALFSWFVGLMNAIWLWFGSTALGSWLLPLLTKLGPTLTIGSWSRRLWRWARRLHRRGHHKTQEALEKLKHEA